MELLIVRSLKDILHECPSSAFMDVLALLGIKRGIKRNSYGIGVEIGKNRPAQGSDSRSRP